MEIGHGDPDDGDIVEAPTKIPVPEEVADAIRTLIRWSGDDPARRKPDYEMRISFGGAKESDFPEAARRLAVGLRSAVS